MPGYKVDRGWRNGRAVDLSTPAPASAPEPTGKPGVRITVRAEPYAVDPSATCWVAEVRVRQHGKWVLLYACMERSRARACERARDWARTTRPSLVVEVIGC